MYFLKTINSITVKINQLLGNRQGSWQKTLSYACLNHGKSPGAVCSGCTGATGRPSAAGAPGGSRTVRGGAEGHIRAGGRAGWHPAGARFYERRFPGAPRGLARLSGPVAVSALRQESSGAQQRPPAPRRLRYLLSGLHRISC